MNKKISVEKGTKKNVKRMQPPKDLVSSVWSSQPTVKLEAQGAHIKTPERPLHDYVVEVCECTEVRSGVPLPMGSHESGGGVNFALFSRHASARTTALKAKHRMLESKHCE